MLTLAILAPLLAAGGIAIIPLAEATARRVAIAAALLPLLVLAIVWSGFETGPAAPAFQFASEAPWIPTIDVAWRVGVDGISLPIAAMSALLFLAAVAWPADTKGRPRHYYAWFLFLEGASLGLFLTLDLLVFYVFFDLSLVGMYFLIGQWGHGESMASALKFFIYTLAGSLAILLAILGLVLSGEAPTFDMRLLIERQPLAGAGAPGLLVLAGFMLGFAIKTPVFPFHTWLPPAHVDAPGPVSAILAGVLLKMGTYGMVRIPLSMMAETFARFALAVGIIAVVSVLWGALVAYAQENLKRRIAYTSVNHMGYAVLGVAAAGSIVGAEAAAARQLALTGAVTQMVAHGLITGALFLIAGGFWQRGQDYELRSYGGLARVAPALTAVTVLAAFASLGLPSLAGFVAEFQVFAGSFAVWPWLVGFAVIGVVITAALFLRMVQDLFFGPLRERRAGFADLGRAELAVLIALLFFVVLIGVWPGWLLDVIDSATATVLEAR